MQTDLRAVLEQLQDENNDQPIELINDRGEKAIFSQMALIPISASSPDYEDEVVEHHFALLQPLNEDGKEMGSRVVFDFIKDENGEIEVKLVDDPYVMRNIMIIYRERGHQFEEAEEEKEECESIFGGTLTASKEETESFEEEDVSAEKEQELQEYVTPHKDEKQKKKGFFGKLFGKK